MTAIATAMIVGTSVAPAQDGSLSNDPASREALQRLKDLMKRIDPEVAIAKKQIERGEVELAATKLRAIIWDYESEGAIYVAKAKTLLGDLELRKGKNIEAYRLLASAKEWLHSDDLSATFELARLAIGENIGDGEYKPLIVLERYNLIPGGLHPQDVPTVASKVEAIGLVKLARGTARYYSGRRSEALQDLLDSARVLPQQPLALYMLGTSMARAGRFSESANYFDRASQLGHEKLKDQAIAMRDKMNALAAKNGNKRG
ncbi:hypothetical protein EON81_16675 [bacterium]|nr:MAG: hypothetical protein EON81_16675 [bacterium]